jgi:hypothetical protein
MIGFASARAGWLAVGRAGLRSAVRISPTRRKACHVLLADPQAKQTEGAA